MLLFAQRAIASASPWLFVTDIHLRAASTRESHPSKPGEDTDPVLFASAIRAMKRADPDPPVVVVTGDLLSHRISKRDATPTAVLVAKLLNGAFPHAQFVLALGNVDSACGDYALAPDSAFLRVLAKAWEPLVNRNGAAPDFLRTFAHDGFYTASLPVPGLRAIAVDDVYWSPRYRAQCGSAGNVVNGSMNELESALAQTPGRAWVLFHIPPGVDAFSTAHLTHRLAIVPFLTPAMRDRFIATLTRNAARVALAVGGHTHKFAFRVVDAGGPHPVPMLLVPAISPIFRDAPAFLTANVAADGTLRDIEARALLDGTWRKVGGLPSLGVDAFTGENLTALSDRLAREPKLRETFANLYEAGAPPEINDRNWSVYVCAARAFTTAAFRDCDRAGGISVITRRGVDVLAVSGGVAIAVIAAAILFVRRRRRLRL